MVIFRGPQQKRCYQIKNFKMDLTQLIIIAAGIICFSTLIYHLFKFLANVLLHLMKSEIGKALNKKLPFIHPKNLNVSVGNIGMFRVSKVLITHKLKKKGDFLEETGQITNNDNKQAQNLRMEIELLKSWPKIVGKIIAAFIKKSKDPIIIEVKNIRLNIQADLLSIQEQSTEFSNDKKEKSSVFSRIIFFMKRREKHRVLDKNAAEVDTSKDTSLNQSLLEDSSTSQNPKAKKTLSSKNKTRWLPNLQLKIYKFRSDIQAESLPVNSAVILIQNFIFNLNSNEGGNSLRFNSEFELQAGLGSEHKIPLLSESLEGQISSQGETPSSPALFEISNEAYNPLLVDSISTKNIDNVDKSEHIQSYFDLQTKIKIDNQNNEKNLQVNVEKTDVNLDLKILKILAEIDVVRYKMAFGNLVTGVMKMGKKAAKYSGENVDFGDEVVDKNRNLRRRHHKNGNFELWFGG